MAFLVRYYDSQLAAFQVVKLTPRPTEVEYPDRRLFKSRTSKDGAVIIQRQMRDPRPRKWIWKRYRTIGTGMDVYAAQWALLEKLDQKARWDAGYTDVTVQIWEDDSAGEGGFNKLTNAAAADLATYTNIVWTTVKFTQVTRSSQKGGGMVVFDSSTVEFVIADAGQYTSY